MGEVEALMVRIAKEKAEVVQPKAAAVAVDEAAAQAKVSISNLLLPGKVSASMTFQWSCLCIYAVTIRLYAATCCSIRTVTVCLTLLNSVALCLEWPALTDLMFARPFPAWYITCLFTLAIVCAGRRGPSHQGGV